MEKQIHPLIAKYAGSIDSKLTLKLSEEEIKCASKDYINYLLDKQEYHNENYTEYDIQQAFEKGAQWADKNPKSPWISVKDDLPCNHKELLHNNNNTKRVLALDNGYPNVKYMSKLSDGNWYWLYAANVTHWMSIPKLDEYNVND